jgi:mono/diheme cytochrome c family protein
LLKRILIGLAAALGLAALALTIVVLVRQNRRFAAPYPAITASSDPALLARGRYLVYGPSHCAYCHGAVERQAELTSGGEIPLTGGMTFDLPIGKTRVPNLTPDPETGIGRLRDGELARVLRHGVTPDGRALLPFMPFNDLSDEDLTAIISFLRAQPAIRNPVPPSERNLLGRVVSALMLKPTGPSGPVVARVPAGPTVEYGRYLTHSVGSCVLCHTQRDERTAAPVGPLFAGGLVLDSHPTPGREFITPNLTPDPRWGWIASWPEEVFVARIHQGAVHENSPMPWSAFKRMSDDDLRAIFRYLRTLPAAPGGPDPSDKQSVLRPQVASR